jgi:predicted site-specific integrase-resolvase
MTTSQIERVLPLPEAAHRMGISVEALTSLVRSGKIQALRLPDGGLAVSEGDLREHMRKEDLPEYKKHARLRGKQIGIAEAARKHNVAVSTVHRWVTRGYITRLGQEGQKVLIDEADVAYCVEIYRAYGSRPRRRLFNDDGTPYVAKSLRTA